MHIFESREMNRAIQIYFFITFVSVSAIGQQLTISSDIPYRTEYAYKMLGQYEDRFLLYLDKPNDKYEITGYNEELQQSWKRELLFEKRNIRIVAVEKMEDAFFIIYTYRNKGDVFLKARKYNGDADVIDSLTIHTYKNELITPRFLYVQSEHDKAGIVFSTDKDFESTFYTLDLTKFVLKWTQTIQFSSFLKQDFRQIEVSDEGELFFVLEKQKSIIKSKNQGYIITYANSEEKAGHYAIELEDISGIDIFIKYDNLHKRLIGAGLYSNAGFSRIHGYYTLHFYGGNISEYTFSQQPFERELLEDVYGKSVSVKKGLTELEITDIALRKDGGFLIITEINKVSDRRSAYGVNAGSQPYYGGRRVDYFNDDLLLFSVLENGEPHWNTVLHKKQHSQNDFASFSSYCLFTNPSSLRIIYNDEIRNENTVSEYVIYPNGRHNRNSLLSTDYYQLSLRFKDAEQISENSLIVASERRNKLNLVKIEY